MDNVSDPSSTLSSSSLSPTKRHRLIDNFSTIRLMLAVLVLYSHSFYLIKLSQESEPVYRFTKGQLDGGVFAVHCFLELSGFLVCSSWYQSAGLGTYALRRFKRIYPAFVAVIFISAFFFAPLGGVHLSDFSLWNWAVRALTLQDPAILCPNFCKTNPDYGYINSPLWTIRYEVAMYAILAIVGFFGVLRKSTALGLFIFFALRLIPGAEIFCRLGAHFFAGVLFYLCSQKVRYRADLVCLAIVSIVCASLFGKWLNFILPIPMTYSLLALALNKKLELRRLVFFTQDADLSYGVYLYAFPIQQLLVFWGIRDITLMFVLSCLLSGLCAFASWNLIESHFLFRWRTNWRTK
jgi:peptidoglycan/LPS O-acetylase OafA/YrhL